MRMARFEEGISIDRSPEDVFAFVSDVDNLPLWQTSMVEIEKQHEGEPTVGSQSRGVNRFMGKRMEFTTEVTAYDPPKRLAIKTVDGPFDYRQEERLEPEGDGCRLTVVGEAPAGLGGLFGKMADPLVAKLYGRSMRGDLEVLKGILEEGAEGDL
jgi:uncharacterized protein YndB with AHSA1/START domain